MDCSFRTRQWVLVFSVLALGLGLATESRADAIGAVAVLRAGGCGGRAAIAPPLHHNASLDQLAAQWAQGQPLVQLATRGGYGAGTLAGVHVLGGGSLPERLSRTDCATLGNPAMKEIGSYQRAPDTWLVLSVAAETHPNIHSTLGQQTAAAGTRYPPPMPVYSSGASTRAPVTPELSRRALELVNEVRARGTRCGSRAFAPAPPLSLSGTLGSVALGHATDMASHSYFEHQDLAGQSPADRVRAVGYKEKLVGENIAYGPQSVDEVMQGWLDSPGHCENIMDPRFVQMGLALAAGHGAKHGLYWVQVLAQPRA
jgi:uncharacterized protein YkwD